MLHIISLSGGLDSTTLLAYVLSKINPETDMVRTVGFDYGSKHNPYELALAAKIAHHYLVPFLRVDLKSVMKDFKSNLLADGGEIPEGHYEDKSMALTVVPARNFIFGSILTGLAESLRVENQKAAVMLGVHAGDHAIYPDCRPEFVDALRWAMEYATENKVTLETPFISLTKGDIVSIGLSLGVPYHLTRTCYKAQDTACGKCGSCTERLEAFAKNNVTDPIEYMTV